MGIRFLCDTCGKKLNIKEELAGKKGRCPKCDAVIKIPKQSTLETTEKSKPVGAMVNADDAPQKSANKDQDEGIAFVDSAGTQDSNPPPLPEVTTSGSSVNGDRQPEPETIHISDEPASDDSPESASQSSTDVLAQNPSAKWFVRPSSGGQFGPAESDVMRTWLAEGRIGRDSLVWCEGWEEWQSATAVFAEQLGEPSVPAEKKEVGVPSTKGSEPSYNRAISHRQARQRARMMGVVLVVGLALVSIALAVVLFIVVNNSGKKSDENEEGDQGKTDTALLLIEPQKNHNQGNCMPLIRHSMIS